MEISFIGIIILVSGILFFYCLYLYDYYSKMDNVISTFDNKTYEVQKKDDSEEAANLLAKIREKIMVLVGHLKMSYPSDPRIERINNNFKSDRIKEGIQKPGVTSYSINKGEQIVLCLRTNNKLMDINNTPNSNKNEISIDNQIFCNIERNEHDENESNIEELENIIYSPKISPEMIKKILKNIRSVIKDAIVKDYDNYLNILYYGFTENLNNSLNDVIFSELNLATSKKRSDWCSYYAHDLSIIVESAIYGLIETAKIAIFTEIIVLV